jgi:hypothetical protein
MSSIELTQRRLRRRLLVYLLSACLLSAASVHGADKELLIKAGFISKFPSYVTWPPAADHRSRHVFRLCVFGNAPILSQLDAIASHTRLNGSPAEVVAAPSIAAAADCHLLFIPRDDAGQQSAIVRQLGERPILLVAESPGAAALGVHINLFESGSRIRFEINRRAFRRSGLAVSFRLLEMAKVVE